MLNINGIREEVLREAAYSYTYYASGFHKNILRNEIDVMVSRDEEKHI